MIWIATALMALGVFFACMGNAGVLKFPDIYTRLHASSKCSTTMIVSIFLACIILSGISMMTAKIIVIGFFSFITGPVTSHIIGRRAWLRGIIPWRQDRIEDR